MKTMKRKKTVKKVAKKAVSKKEELQCSCGGFNIAMFLLRVCMGWVFLYAGISKLIDPTWTAYGFLMSAKTFPVFYAWLASPQNIDVVNVLNSWGLTLIGAGLITGTLTRVASLFGILIMALYYFPGLEFPYVEHSLLVDEHVVYIFVLIVLSVYRAGEYLGVDQFIVKLNKK